MKLDSDCLFFVDLDVLVCFFLKFYVGLLVVDDGYCEEGKKCRE